VLDSKLTKIKDLIIQKERIESELAILLGETDKPAKRGRPSKDKTTEVPGVTMTE
jgi:hypothetical protein